jgi:ribosomal protein S12 methylthiotransferase accessory factor
MPDHEIRITLPGGHRVDAEYRGFTISTDQPVHAGGTNTAPAPFDLFLGSLATCAGYYVLAFCRERQIATEGITLTMTMEKPQGSKLYTKIGIIIHLPAGFPEKYRAAVIKAADTCAVKAHIMNPPAFMITAD